MQYQASFERAYQAYKRDIYLFTFGLLRREQEAKELTQETFLGFLEELQKGEMPRERERPWLYRVAKNKCLNWLRGRKAETPMTELLEDQRRSPEGEIAQAQEKQMVRVVMDTMGEREATLLRLYTLDLSYKEMAQVMEVEQTSIGRMLHRAKQSFKVKYEQHKRGGTDHSVVQAIS